MAAIFQFQFAKDLTVIAIAMQDIIKHVRLYDLYILGHNEATFVVLYDKNSDHVNDYTASMNSTAKYLWHYR